MGALGDYRLGVKHRPLKAASSTKPYHDRHSESSNLHCRPLPSGALILRLFALLFGKHLTCFLIETHKSKQAPLWEMKIKDWEILVLWHPLAKVVL
jgi:hypothetical protein